MYIRMTKWYQSTITGKYLWDFEVKYPGEEIYGPGRLEELLKTGVLKEVDPPTVIDLLKQDRNGAAARRYVDIHHTTLGEAHNMLKLIQEDMKKYENRD